MANINQIPVRAKIVGGGINAQTPYVLSFTVNKRRGQPSTFQASVKMKAHDVGSISGNIQIWAGQGSPSRKIFTGIITEATMTPSFDDPTYVVINVSGSDVLKLLEGKKFVRRQITAEACWMEITGVNRRGLRSSKFKYLKGQPTFILTDSLASNSEVVQTADIGNFNMLNNIGSAPKSVVNDEIVPLEVDFISE